MVFLGASFQRQIAQITVSARYYCEFTRRDTPKGIVTTCLDFYHSRYPVSFLKHQNGRSLSAMASPPHLKPPTIRTIP
jgi:hypothetical protein